MSNEYRPPFRVERTVREVIMEWFKRRKDREARCAELQKQGYQVESYFPWEGSDTSWHLIATKTVQEGKQ